ncbi:hypothetical protein CQW23_35538 [Capsicum baccatum]|uniref:Uncharacterized protein n=1 Tax=Capsicum baccatum TaxID=33114 RepID=A0A2G2UVP5_CAPBA|nr:hypothetical protein CQW23_35538 [Capsicum baccatum]
MAKRVELQPLLSAMSVDVDSYLGQQRARGAREASIRPATTARRMIEARCEGAMRCVMPRQTCPRPNGFGRNLRSKTRWFTGFCNSHQVSHFATFFIDARAEISVAESLFHLQKKAQVPPTHAADGARGAGYRFKYSLALSASRFVGRPPRTLGARSGDGGRHSCEDQPGSIPHRRRRRMSPACPRGRRRIQGERDRRLQGASYGADMRR